MHFLKISNISASVDNSKSTSVFLKHICHTDLGAEENKQDLVHNFQPLVPKTFKYVRNIQRLFSYIQDFTNNLCIYFSADLPQDYQLDLTKSWP